MKKLLSLTLILLMILSLISSCEQAPIEPSIGESSLPTSSSDADTSEPSTSNPSNTTEPSVAEYKLPRLIEKEYYEVLDHGENDFGAEMRREGKYCYKVLWTYEQYEKSLSSTVLPIADKYLFDDNIVIFISANPYYQYNQYNEDYKVIYGFKSFLYTYDKMEITIEYLADIGKREYYPMYNDAPIKPTYIVIPKTEQNGLGHHAMNYHVYLEIREESYIKKPYDIVEVTSPTAPPIEQDKFWLIRSEEDFNSFVEETGIEILDKTPFRRYPDAIQIIHYSPYKRLNSVSQKYIDIRMRSNGAIYIDYNRVFLDNRAIPEEKTHTYTVINAFDLTLDFNKLSISGELVCTRNDFYVEPSTIFGNNKLPIENRYYPEIALIDGISEFMPDFNLTGEYEKFYLFTTKEELISFGFNPIHCQEITWSNYYYLVSARGYINREYKDIGFANFRVENERGIIDLYQAPIASPEQATEELSIILIPREKIPKIDLTDISISYVRQEYFAQISDTKHAGQSDIAEFGAGKVYTNDINYYANNYIDETKIKDEIINEPTEREEVEVNAEIFDDNIIIVIERRENYYNAWTKHYILGYRDAKIVDGEIQLTVDVLRDANDWNDLYDSNSNAYHDDHIIIPKELLGDFVATENTRVRLVINEKSYFEYGEMSFDVLE